MAAKNGNLENALAVLIQNQASFISHLAETKMEVVAIRSDLEQIKEILVAHGQILAELPEAIREKIGYNRI